MSIYKLIQLQNQWILVIDRNVLKEDGWCYDMYSKKIITPEENLKATPNAADYYCRIIAGIETLPLIKFDNDELTNKVGYVDIDKKRQKVLNKYAGILSKSNHSPEEIDKITERDYYGLYQGFQIAELINENKYSLEDIRKAIEMARESNPNTLNHPEYGFEYNYTENTIIESLSQPKMWSVEIQMENICCQTGMPCGMACNGLDNCEKNKRPQIANNSIVITKIL